MVMVLDANVAVTPFGKPAAVPIPVAPVVVWVISVKAILLHTTGAEDAAPAVLLNTVIAMAADVALQPLLLVATTVYVPLAVAI